MNEATRSLVEAKSIALAAYRKKTQAWMDRSFGLVKLEVEWETSTEQVPPGAVEDGEKMNGLQSVARAVVEIGHKKEALAWATSQISHVTERSLSLVLPMPCYPAHRRPLDVRS